MKKRERRYKGHFFSLSISWILGFLFTFAILVTSKMIGYQIIAQQTHTGLINDLSTALNFVQKSIKAPEIALSVMGGFLSFGLRYLFLFGKPYSV